jgi:eukaryotic-like serine/threonine-protein kinase
MSATNHSRFAVLDDRIDAICDEFESSWKSGDRPSLSEYVDPKTDVPLETLILELIQIDMHYRRKRGEIPSAADYATLFPDHTDAIQRMAIANEITVAVQQFDLDEQGERRRFGRYELHEELGQGGFGVVWRAWDTELQRWVALKIARVSDSPEIRRLFRREAQVMASMNDPSIVRVFDFGIEKNLAFITSELVDGESLAKALEHRSFTLEQILQFAMQIASGLEHVHSQGILHRDLKPANILLSSDDRVVIADFGLARHSSLDSTIMQPGHLMGTIPYMSPEQVQGHALDPRTDIYSLGVILYRLIAGQSPYEGSREELRHQILSGQPRDPGELNPQVTPSLSAVCLKAMALVPNHRYASAGELRRDLELLLSGETVVIPAPRLQHRPFETLVGNRRAVLASAASVGVLGLGGYLLSRVWPGVTVPVPAGTADDVDVPVRITTTPEGASIVLHPVNYQTGRVEPEKRIVVAEKTPVDMDLKNGDYLVVAYFDDGRFHEVYRHVRHPGRNEGLAFGWGHAFSRVENGRHVLPIISIPDSDPTEGMSQIAGHSAFVLPPFYHNERLKRFAVPEFYVDQYEFTQGERRDLSPSESNKERYVTDGDDYPLRNLITFDQYVSLAEMLGKRLLTDLEHYNVATNGGATKYPWGNAMHPDAATFGSELTPVGQPDWDRTGHDPPVYGLCSGVAEWVDTQPLLEVEGIETAIQPMQRNHFLIKGGSENVQLGNFAITEQDRNPRDAVVRDRMLWLPGLGCRFARSVMPRLTPEDFLQELVEAKD